MHTQEQEVQRRRGGWLIDFGGVVGLVLYVLTLALETALGVLARWLPVFVAASAAGLIGSSFVEMGWWQPEVLAWLASLGPAGYSLARFVAPRARGKWVAGSEARRMTAEEERLFTEAIDFLRAADPGLVEPTSCFVLDDPESQALSRGRTVFVTRGAFESGELAPLLAHELGHLETLDGRITEALGRMVLWEDPLGPTRAEALEGKYVQAEIDVGGKKLWWIARWWLRLAGGSLIQSVSRPLWAWYWRWREYAADEFAVSLDQGEDLARVLEDREQGLDMSPRRRILNLEQHPPVAFRLERLRGEWRGGWLRRAVARGREWGQSGPC